MGQTLSQFLEFLRNTQLITGVFIGILTGYLANTLYDLAKKRRFKARLETFIRELNESMKNYLDVVPKSEDEVNKRRDEIAQKVRELSTRIFKENYPPFESFRLEQTEYPEIDCKWCYRPHKAHHGSRGDCRKCNLPLDIWIGCQNKSNDELKESKRTSIKDGGA